MRVTAETKARTAETIAKAASTLFREKGFQQVSTRDISRAAGIATGTLFNYFPSKEALAAELLAREFAAARELFTELCRGDESLEEQLFLLLACQLLRLAECPTVLAGALTGLPHATDDAVAELLRAAGHDPDRNPIALQQFRALQWGVLTFWLSDASPGKEDSLAVADRTTRMFVAALPTVVAAPTPGEDRE